MKEPISPKRYREFYVATAIQKVLEVFYKFPEKEFSLSDLAKEAGVQKSNLGEIVKMLERDGFLQIEKLTKIWRIKANRQNWRFIRSKIVYNLNFVYQSGLVEFLYERFNHPKAVILFGSFRKGEDISSSDIDIAIEDNSIKDYQTSGLKELVKFEEVIGRNIQIHKFNRSNMDINVFNNIANGIVLFGFLEVKP